MKSFEGNTEKFFSFSDRWRHLTGDDLQRLTTSLHSWVLLLFTRTVQFICNKCPATEITITQIRKLAAQPYYYAKKKKSFKWQLKIYWTLPTNFPSYILHFYFLSCKIFNMPVYFLFFCLFISKHWVTPPVWKEINTRLQAFRSRIQSVRIYRSVLEKPVHKHIQPFFIYLLARCTNITPPKKIFFTPILSLLQAKYNTSGSWLIAREQWLHRLYVFFIWCRFKAITLSEIFQSNII